jgi:hypothetical protein
MAAFQKIEAERFQDPGGTEAERQSAVSLCVIGVLSGLFWRVWL